MSKPKVAQPPAKEKPKPAAPAPPATRSITAAKELNRQIWLIILLGERLQAAIRSLQSEEDEHWCTVILQEDAERSVNELVEVAKAHRHGLREFCERQPAAAA